MRVSLLLACLMAVGFSSLAKDPLKGKVVCEADKKPIAYARIVAEFPDTVVNYQADRKGRFCIDALSFPVTITAKADGVMDATIGLMSMPESKVVIELSPDPSYSKPVLSRRVDWSSAEAPHRGSTYILRNK